MKLEDAADDVLSKESRIVDFLGEINDLAEATAGIREQVKDLKQNYLRNRWLTKDDISLALRANRLYKSDIDIEQLNDFYKTAQEVVKDV